jgi:hypothetical protein
MTNINESQVEIFKKETGEMRNLVGNLISNGILSLKETQEMNWNGGRDNLLMIFSQLDLVEQL